MNIEMSSNNEEEEDVGVMEAMTQEEVINTFLQKDGALVMDNFELLPKTIQEMQGNLMKKKVDLRFGLEADAIKMKNFLQGNNGWIKETFGVDIVKVDRMKEFVILNLESR